MSNKYQLPEFLEGKTNQATYENWLHRKVNTHFRRDKKRGNKNSSRKIYKEAFHKAVIDSKGKDFYTKEELDWSLISKYNNKQSKEGGRNYKKKFALLPTIDHYDDKYENFVICSWRINDAKNDLSHHEFIELCKKVIKASAMNLHSR